MEGSDDPPGKKNGAKRRKLFGGPRTRAKNRVFAHFFWKKKSVKHSPIRQNRWTPKTVLSPWRSQSPPLGPNGGGVCLPLHRPQSRHSLNILPPPLGQIWEPTEAVIQVAHFKIQTGLDNEKQNYFIQWKKNTKKVKHTCCTPLPCLALETLHTACLPTSFSPAKTSAIKTYKMAYFYG